MLARWKWWLSPVDCVTAMSHNDWRKERQERQKKMKGQSPSWDVVEGWKKDCVLPWVGWLKKEERSSWLLHKNRTLAYVSACGLPLLYRCSLTFRIWFTWYDILILCTSVCIHLATSCFDTNTELSRVLSLWIPRQWLGIYTASPPSKKSLIEIAS